jgi:tetratricopeptide (TPR) repeat protein
VQPDHPLLPLYLARTARHAGRLEEAAAYLDQIGPELCDRPDILKLTAEIAFARQDYETARMKYTDYLQTSDSDAAAWSDLGNVFFRQENWPKAHECYATALECEPQLYVALRNRALVCARQGQLDQATDLLQQYITCAGGDPDAVRLLADLRAGHGQHDQALTLYEQYLAQRPDDTAALFSLSQSYHAMGQEDAAILGYRHVLSREPGFEPAKAALAALGQS